MSKTKTVSTLAASLAILAGACWFVTGALPLSAQPQLANDSPGITVDLMGSQLMHRAPVFYPRAALAKSLEGVVLAQVKLDQGGNVTDASILSGPDGLRRPVLQSLLLWHFTKDAAGGTRQIAVTFRVPAASSSSAAATPIVDATPLALRRAEIANQTTEHAQPAVTSIQLQGIGIPADELLPKLPLHVNDAWSPESMTKLVEAVKQIDEHLNVSSMRMPSGAVTVLISAPRVANPEQPAVTGPITVGGRVQTRKLVSSPQPVYPDAARQAGVSGTVEFSAVIGPDGHMQELQVINGDPLLRQAAIDAVKRWVYQPTLLNGQPVAVSTTIEVNVQ